MGRIILVRHSIPAIDPDRPACHWILSPEGVTAAEDLADRLGGFDLTRIVSSDEPKARQTAEIIARAHHWGLDLDPDLREQDRGAVGYLPRADFEAGIARVFASPGELVFGAETADQILARFHTAIARAQHANPGRDILAVTHGTALAIYLSRVAGIDPLSFWQTMTLPMAVLLEAGTVSRLE
jgi:broad specificity phosphatase PhoE